MSKTVHELKRKREAQLSTKRRIYNPDLEDFTVQYDGQDYTIHAMEIVQFPTHIAEHIEKHLADRLLHKRGINTNAKDDLAKIREEICVDE